MGHLCVGNVNASREGSRMLDDDHRCRSGKQCVNRTPEAAAATTKPDTLCPACIGEIQDCRDRLGAATDALKLFIGIKVQGVGVKVSASKTPPAPINIAAHDLITEIDVLMFRVGNLLVRDLIKQPLTKVKYWSAEFEQLRVWDGVDWALQIRHLYRRALALTGFERSWQRRHAPCKDCSLPCLGQMSGSEVVQCSNCGTCMSDVEYQNYCVELVKGK